MLAILGAASLVGCGGETAGGSEVTINAAGATGGVSNANGQGAMSEVPITGGSAGSGGVTGTGGTSSLDGGPATGGTGGSPSTSGGTCPGSIWTVSPTFEGCHLVIPTLPAGQSLDPEESLVVYTASTDANPQALHYNPDMLCSFVGSGNETVGWTDSVSTPLDTTAIALCTVSCSQVKADPSPELLFEACLVPGRVLPPTP